MPGAVIRRTLPAATSCTQALRQGVAAGQHFPNHRRLQPAEIGVAEDVVEKLPGVVECGARGRIETHAPLCQKPPLSALRPLGDYAGLE